MSNEKKPGPKAEKWAAPTPQPPRDTPPYRLSAGWRLRMRSQRLAESSTQRGSTCGTPEDVIPKSRRIDFVPAGAHFPTSVIGGFRHEDESNADFENDKSPIAVRESPYRQIAKSLIGPMGRLSNHAMAGHRRHRLPHIGYRQCQVRR